MKQIKTIIKQYADEFDEVVNAALAEGWTLTRREVLPPFEGERFYVVQKLYAELEREAEECNK